MKILAINGSPRGKKGNTECILQAFLEGAQSVGAKTETIYLVNKDIHHCTGCYSCWTKTPGTCIHKDDMPDLLVKIREAEIMVFATPLYFYNVTGLMKDFIDRMLPLSKANLDYDGKHYYHKGRFEESGIKKKVLISNCGFPGKYNFSGLVETFKIMMDGKLDATILCSEGELLRHNHEGLKDLLTHYFTAVKEAGKEVVQSGYIIPETQSILDRELIKPEMYLEAANSHWDNY